MVMKIKLIVLTVAMLAVSQVAYADGWILWIQSRLLDMKQDNLEIMTPSQYAHGFVDKGSCDEAAISHLKGIEGYELFQSKIDDTHWYAQKIISKDKIKVENAFCYPSDFDPREKK